LKRLDNWLKLEPFSKVEGRPDVTAEAQREQSQFQEQQEKK